jgi:tetratricopeptide (TPR) repeat protein
MLLPVIGLMQVGSQAMADRYTYLTQIGLYIALAWAAADICRSWPYRRSVCAIASALVLAVLMGCAWRQTSFWRDSETLWNHALVCTSQNWVAHNSLGLALKHLDRSDEAVEHYRKALAIKPDCAEALNNLGNFSAAHGRPDEAFAYYRKAVQANPGDAGSHNNLGIALAGRGQFDEAVAQYQKAVAIQPDYAEAYYNLGNAFAALGRFDEATARFQQALAIKPDYAKVHYNLGLALQASGKIDEAIAQLLRATEIEPGYSEVHNCLGTFLADRGQFEEAIAEYRKTLTIKPDFIEAHNNLAWLRATCQEPSLRNGAEAIEHAQRANQLSGGNRPSILDTLAAAYAEAGQLSKALATARKALELAIQQNHRDLAKVLRTRIALYEAGKPYRQMPSAPFPPNP